MTKKIKVVILPKVSIFHAPDGKTYRPNDVAEIPENYFRADFMAKVEDTPAAPATTEAPATGEPSPSKPASKRRGPQ